MLLVATTLGDVEDLHRAVDIGRDAEPRHQQLMCTGGVFRSDRAWREGEVSGHGQMWSARPSAASAASFETSDNVGCACTVPPMSSADARDSDPGTSAATLA